MSVPLITCALTAYNAQDTIEKAVTSALSQNWPEEQLEILIVDDASTDNTRTVLQKLKDRFAHIHLLFHDTNKGVAAARNTLLKNANGTYIAFFDDDDISDSQRLRLQYERLCSVEEKLGEDSFVLCHTVRLLRTDSSNKDRLMPTIGTGESVPGGRDVALHLLTGYGGRNIYGTLASCTLMTRVAQLRALDGGFDPQFARSEDTDLYIRAALKGAVFAGLEEALVTQTRTAGADKTPAIEHAHLLNLLRKHAYILETPGALDFYESWLKMKSGYQQKDLGRFMTSAVQLVMRHPRPFAAKCRQAAHRQIQHIKQANHA